jgi:hypothetical protein
MNAATFFRHVYADNKLRTGGKRSLYRDVQLWAKNRALQPLEFALAQYYRDPSIPACFIVGVPRSGTTVLFQAMARHVDITYINNFVARYWMAPLAGLMRYQRSHGQGPKTIPLRSSFGVADGVHSPHEFAWFWQFHCGFFETDDLIEMELDMFDWSSIRREIEGIAGWGRRPVVFKSLNYVVYNVKRFARELANSKFIYIRRDLRYVIQSIMENRIARYGTEDQWWTIRPRDIGQWRSVPPLDQVVHQALDIRNALELSIYDLPAERRLVVDYEDLVEDTPSVVKAVANFLGAGLLDAGDLERLKLEDGNKRRFVAERWERMNVLLRGSG